MGSIYENRSVLNLETQNAEKHVTFGKVQTYEYNNKEQKIPVRKRIQGFLDSALTIKKDENWSKIKAFNVAIDWFFIFLNNRSFFVMCKQIQHLRYLHSCFNNEGCSQWPHPSSGSALSAAGLQLHRGDLSRHISLHCCLERTLMGRWRIWVGLTPQNTMQRMVFISCNVTPIVHSLDEMLCRCDNHAVQHRNSFVMSTSTAG